MNEIRESGSIAVNCGVAHVASRNHVDHVLGDIGSVVRDTLQIFATRISSNAGKTTEESPIM